MKKSLKKIVSAILSLIMLITVCPAQGLALSTLNTNKVSRYTVLILETAQETDFLDGNGGVLYTADSAIDYVKKSGKKFVEDILKSSGNNYIALVSYNSDAVVLSDFSDNVYSVSQKIDEINATGGRNIASGLEKANELISKINDENAKINVILISTGMTNYGEHSNIGHYDNSTVGSQWYNIGTDIHLYEFANVAYDKAEEIKSKATLYSLGLFQTMEGMPEKGKDIAEFFRLTAKDLASSEDNFYEVENPEEIGFVFDDIASDILTKDATVKFAGQAVADHDTEVPYHYEDSYFFESAQEYNPHLATMSLLFELSTWPSHESDLWTNDAMVDDDIPKFINARNLLIGDISKADDNGLGFDSFAVNDDWGSSPKKDSIGVLAARKKITDENDKEFTLIALGIRGGNYGLEWGGNFMVGSDGQHQGFDEAKSKVLDFLSSYIAKNKISGDTKLWLVGFSRGAATANLTAAALIDKYELPNGVSFDRDTLYAYTFETPQGSVYDNNASRYSNIHNVVNRYDLVPMVAPDVWNFTRYNRSNDHFLDIGVMENNPYTDAMLGFYNQIEGTTNGYNSYNVKKYMTEKKLKCNPLKVLPGGDPLIYFVDDRTEDTSLELKKFSDFLFGEVFESRQHYVDSYQYDVSELTAKFLGGDGEKILNNIKSKLDNNTILSILSPLANPFLSRDKKFEKIDENISKFIQSTGLDTSDHIVSTAVQLLEDIIFSVASDYIVNGGNYNNAVYGVLFIMMNTDSIMSSSVFKAHWPEVCLAWLMSEDDNYNINANSEQKIQTRSYRKIRINCPVDINVYDSNNTLIAAIKNDEPQEIDGNKAAYINIEDEKLIDLSVDETYTVEIIPTDDGILNYSVNELSFETVDNSRIINYYNIPIRKGEMLKGIVPAFSDDEVESSIPDGSTTAYKLFNSDGTEITADEDITGDAARNANYSVKATAGDEYGVVMGGGTYARGNFAEVEAYPISGSSLIGWYKNNELVSTDITYRFAVTEDTELVAKFTPVEKYTVTFVAENGGGITNETLECSAGTQISLEAIAETGYKFTAWDADSGTFENKNSATTWFTMPANDVTVTASFSRKSSGGGGSSSYTVKFDTNGGSDISSQKISKNSVVKEVSAPIKDGYVFAGWYTDKALTKPYDFTSKVTSSFTLYAKWNDSSLSQIIMQIGKLDAMVFGEKKRNDVAPIIVKDRTMLPARFVAENLGAKVTWNEDSRTVTITKGDINIFLTIDSDKAIVNGKTVSLDSSAFIQNDRTYTPVRFIAENLGAIVEWDEDSQTVTITQ